MCLLLSLKLRSQKVVRRSNRVAYRQKTAFFAVRIDTFEVVYIYGQGNH